MVHSRSSFQHSPDGFIPPFPVSLTTSIIGSTQQPAVWTLILQSGSEGPALISNAAWLLRSYSLHENSFAPSWRTIIRISGKGIVRVFPLHPRVEGIVHVQVHQDGADH